MDYQLNALEKCICCGADVPVAPDASSARCAYCRTVMSITRFSKKEKQLTEELSQLHGSVDETNAMMKAYLASEDGKLLRLYRQAEEAQFSGRFEEAIALYKQVIVQSPQEEAELHWRVMLCRYGVQYVHDQTSGECLPTITRMVVDSVLEDEDFRAARQLAPDGSVQMYYVREARRINDILRDYLEINGTETPYDVFISVKQGDANGRPTNDSVTAMELHSMLDKLGLKVFNSRITLQNYSGFEYEPYIMHALSTAKVLILVVSCEEYMNSPWLKNEWSRFHWLQKNDKSISRSLITYVIGNQKWNMQELGKIQLIYALTHTDPKAALRAAVEKACGLKKADEAQPQGMPDISGIDPALLAQALAMLQKQQTQNQAASVPAQAASKPVPPAPKPMPPAPKAEPKPVQSVLKPAPKPIQSPADQIVNIGDKALEKVLREKLGKLSYTPITVGELARIASLKAINRNIQDITALRYCTAMIWLDLSENRITDISSLTNLTALTELNLWHNRITDISPLSNLTALRVLNLNRNQITDLSPLSNLTALKVLNLESNRITDISPLANLTALTTLYLDKSISGVGLLSRLFSSHSNSEVIAQLKSRGCRINA